MLFAITRDGKKLLSFGSLKKRSEEIAKYTRGEDDSLAAISKYAARCINAKGGFAAHPSVNNDDPKINRYGPESVHAFWITP